MSVSVVATTSLLPHSRLLFHKVRAVPFLRLLPRTTILVDGLEFQFVLVSYAGGPSRAYIVGSPGYRGRPTSLEATHRMRDSLGRPYVCWTPEPADPSTMATVLALWVFATCQYRDSGVFPDARSSMKGRR